MLLQDKTLLNSDFKDMLSALKQEKAEYLLVEGYALAAHGQPRATGDMDLWVRPSEENARKVWSALAKFGAPLSDTPFSYFAHPDHVFQIGLPPNRIDVLTSVAGVEFDEAWPSRLLTQVDGIKITVIGWKHLLQNKKAAGRPKDLVDVNTLLLVEKVRQSLPDKIHPPRPAKGKKPRSPTKVRGLNKKVGRQARTG